MAHGATVKNARRNTKSAIDRGDVRRVERSRWAAAMSFVRPEL
jgi:hypothetical protein